jgi:hypothetical protein
MTKRISAMFFVLLIAGGLSVFAATETTYTSKWYGFITSSEEIDKRKNITADEIKKSIAEKNGKYVLYNGLIIPYLRLMPQDKAAAYAGKKVWVHGSITSKSLTKASEFVAGSSSAGAGGPFTINISSVEIYTGPDDDVY